MRITVKDFKRHTFHNTENNDQPSFTVTLKIEGETVLERVMLENGPRNDYGESHTELELQTNAYSAETCDILEKMFKESRLQRTT